MNNIDVGDVAGVLAGYRSGQISYGVAKQLLRSYGTGDRLIDELLSVGVGVATGMFVGDIVDSFVDGIFGD